MDISNNNLISSVAAAKAPEEIAVSKPVPGAVDRSFQAQSTPTAAAQQAAGEQQLEQAVAKINDYVQNQQRTLQFSVDEDSGRNVVKVLDKQTEEVIRQIPQEEVLVIARRIEELADENLNLFSSIA